MKDVLPIALAIGLLAACGTDSEDPGPIDPDDIEQVTYFEHVKPILDAKCAYCHYDGGIAPFALLDYDSAVANAGVSMLAINDKIMPPWLTDSSCNDYVGDRSLTEDQITIFNRWVDEGTLRGDPADEGAPLDVERLTMSRVDQSLSMAEPYTPTKSPDDYRCFLIEWPEQTDTKYLTGFRAVPGNESIVHHVIAFLATPNQKQTYYDLDANEAGPGYTCFGGPGGPAQQWIGSWAPGSQGSDLPDGTGIEIPAGSLVILQVHYNTLTTDPVQDTTGIDLKIDDQVDKIGTIQPWTNPSWLSGDNMMIPANQADVVHSFGFDPTPFISGGQPIQIHAAGFHMHTLGKSGLLRVDHSDGSSTCLVDIPRWDFDWQGSYGFRTPVEVQPGDSVYIECHWDNTTENQPIVEGQPLPPRDVTWGEGTTDEMCLGGFYFTRL